MIDRGLSDQSGGDALFCVGSDGGTKPSVRKASEPMLPNAPRVPSERHARRSLHEFKRFGLPPHPATPTLPPSKQSRSERNLIVSTEQDHVFPTSRPAGRTRHV